ncbi:hypothetical protein [Sphingomonas oryzagri]
MVDCASAHIQLGGTLSRQNLSELVSAIENDGAAIDWEGTTFDPGSITGSRPIDLMNCEMPYGRFRCIEDCCREIGLEYVRWSGGCSGSFPPTREIFTGSGEHRTFLVTDDDDLVFSIEDIRKLGTIEAIEQENAIANRKPPPLIIRDGDVPTIDERKVRHG